AAPQPRLAIRSGGHRPERNPPMTAAPSSQRGMVAVELPLVLCLFLVPVALLVITLPTWPERQTVARAAATQAARTMVLAGTWDTGQAQAAADVRQAAANQGIDPNAMQLTLSGDLVRGGQVTAHVTVTMPAVR